MLRLATWILIASAGAAGCVVGAPHGFSKGDSWTLPLVSPLDDGVLLTPVYINGSGPYLFMIDPDSPMSSIDEGIVSELDLYNGLGPEQINENDDSIPVRQAEVRNLSVGNLTVSNRRVRVHKTGAFWSSGRRVRGLLGRNVIADSLVFAVDRDRGVAYLATQGHLDPPAGATAIHYKNLTCRHCTPGRSDTSIEPSEVIRRLVSVRLNERYPVTMHLDIGARMSMLRPEKLRELGMPRLPIRATLVDELGTRRWPRFSK